MIVVFVVNAPAAHRFQRSRHTLYNRPVPAPPKVNKTQIIAAALDLLERNGREGFTMADVAAAVGVRAPSLYGHFADRAALLEELEQSLWDELTRSLTSHVLKGRPIETIKAQARAYRRFATQYPNGYALMLDVRSSNTEQGVRARAEAVNSTLLALSTLVGESQALVAARVLTPFVHGFVSMENSAAFRLGPGIDAAFEHGIDTILRGLIDATRAKPGAKTRERPPSRRSRNAS
jgi:AcrR family transcriptional regulator